MGESLLKSDSFYKHNHRYPVRKDYFNRSNGFWIIEVIKKELLLLKLLGSKFGVHKVVSFGVMSHNGT